MADFNRTYAVPSGSTWPKFPTGLESWGQSGKGQFRTTTQVGRTWEESYPPMKADAANTRAFIAYLNQLWNQKTIFTIKHPHLETPLGTISGSLTANGENQTGSTLTVNAYTGTLLAGDIISIAGVNLIFDVIATPSSTTITISPPLVSGMNFSNGAVITYTGVTFRATLAEELVLPRSSYTEWYEGLTIRLRECP